MSLDVELYAEVPKSKSILNRLLIIDSFCENPPKRNLTGQAEDVFNLSKALELFKKGASEFDCGDGAAVLRFLALRVSCESGAYLLNGSKRLFERNHTALINLLKSLGMNAEIYQNSLKLSSCGEWNTKAQLVFDLNDSSQYASALALSSWGKNISLQFNQKLSPGTYFDMTLSLLKKSGLKFAVQDQSLQIFPSQPQRLDLEEGDWSSAFALASIGLLKNGTQIRGLGFWEKSLQPDASLVRILRSMGAKIDESQNVLKVHPTPMLKSINVNLEHCPDLFPVLSVLCSFADGKSKLFGASRLVNKESNRILSTAKLLEKMGAAHEVLEDGIVILGPVQKKVSFEFDPDSDHRMAMAAAVAQAGGFTVNILNKNVVNKSFPNFWKQCAL